MLSLQNSQTVIWTGLSCHVQVVKLAANSLLFIRAHTFLLAAYNFLYQGTIKAGIFYLDHIGYFKQETLVQNIDLRLETEKSLLFRAVGEVIYFENLDGDMLLRIQIGCQLNSTRGDHQYVIEWTYFAYRPSPIVLWIMYRSSSTFLVSSCSVLGSENGFCGWVLYGDPWCLRCLWFLVSILSKVINKTQKPLYCSVKIYSALIQ